MSVPLAERIRPKTLDDIVGQTHLLGENKPLRRIIESGKIPNMIFYGPSGVGKTTVARMIANNACFILTRYSILTKNNSNRFLNTLKTAR